MVTAKQIGRVGALAVALGVGNVRRNATRMTVSIGATAVVVVATLVPASDSTGSPAVKLSADSTALVMCGTTCPTPDEFWVESAANQFIAPTHPGQDIEYVAVTAPMESWPFTGLFRLLGLALGPSEIWGPGGPGWPDESWWKLSGLFDLTGDQSIQAGVASLEAAMAANGNDHLVIYGYSQGAAVANAEKRRLAEQYPPGTDAPDIDFVLGGDFNAPNGGLFARFPGLYVPILDWSFTGPEPTDTQFATVVITRQYDGFAYFPLYPLNLIADLNAVLGALYVHTYPFDVSLPADPTTSPAYQGTHGDTSYYFFETQDLPLFGPLRSLGVPEALIDVFEPFFKVIVELGYDRSIPPWEPTPARLIPTLDPAKVITDLGNAIGEGVDNAAALFGAPAPASHAPTHTETLGSTETATEDGQGSTATSSPTSEVTEIADSGDSSTEQPAADGASASAVTASSERAKPTLRPATPRPIVRDSLNATEQPRGPVQRGKGRVASTTGTSAADPATTERSSSSDSSAAAARSSSASDSSAGDSSGGDAGDSD